MSEEVLQIPCTLFRIATLPVGGHRLSFDTPDVAARSVRELLGTENKQNFILCLVKVEEGSKKEPSKCRNTSRRLTFKK